MKKNTAKNEAANFDSRQFLKDGAVEKSLGVFGSRSLSDDRVKVLILEALNHGGYTKIISCLEPGGVSAVAREVASEFGYPVQTHCLNLRYLRGAFEQRSMEVIALADAFLIIHDGKSKGTINEKILCEQSGKPIQYELLVPLPFKSSSGFIECVEDWSVEDWSVEDWSVEELELDLELE